MAKRRAEKCVGSHKDGHVKDGPEQKNGSAPYAEVPDYMEEEFSDDLLPDLKSTYTPDNREAPIHGR